MCVRGGVTPFGKADRKGAFRGVFGILRKSLRCRAAMSETAILRCRAAMSEREDYEINLRQLSKGLNQYQGNFWTVIISLSREDADRLGFDNATRWRDFLRSERSEIAEQFHIPQGMKSE